MADATVFKQALRLAGKKRGQFGLSYLFLILVSLTAERTVGRQLEFAADRGVAIAIRRPLRVGSQLDLASSVFLRHLFLPMFGVRN